MKCQHREYQETDDHWPTGAECQNEATHLSCSPIIDQSVCAEHKCRVNQLIGNKTMSKDMPLVLTGIEEYGCRTQGRVHSQERWIATLDQCRSLLQKTLSEKTDLQDEIARLNDRISELEKELGDPVCSRCLERR